QKTSHIDDTTRTATERHTLSLHDALPILVGAQAEHARRPRDRRVRLVGDVGHGVAGEPADHPLARARECRQVRGGAAANLTALADRKSTRLNSSHLGISYAVFCLKKKIKQ